MSSGGHLFYYHGELTQEANTKLFDFSIGVNSVGLGLNLARANLVGPAANMPYVP